MDYFNLNVDLLFEQYSIKEIESLNYNIQNEIDGKKEELRTMVGERYRDLLTAADTITEMKHTCEKIENVISKSKPISWNNLQDLKDEQTFSSKSIYYAAQIKILMNLTESISSCMDKHNFLEATQLFLLSRHINLSLKLDNDSKTIEKFPVVQKIWDFIAPFQNTIKLNCLSALEEKTIDEKKTVDCLASLILLENGEFTTSLKSFISIREKVFLQILIEENEENVKDKLFLSVMELVNTTKIIYDSFISYNGQDGLLIQTINSINTGDSTQFLFKKHSIPNTRLINRFKYRCAPRVLTSEEIQKDSSVWISSIEKIVQTRLKNVVKHIVSIDTIREIENQVQNIEKPNMWSNICVTMFSLKHLDFYQRFYQPLILERMYKIIDISWESIQAGFKDEIMRLTVLINDRVHRQSSYYVWMNDDQDNPKSLNDALNVEQKMHNLLMKVKGYSRQIVDICSKLDLNLQKLITDLKQYCTELIKSSLQKDFRPYNYTIPKEKLLDYLKDSSTFNVSLLINFVKSSVLINDVENCHILARLLQAISELCPNLKQCFSKNLLIDQTALFENSNFEDSDQWKKVAKLLTDESIQLWRNWLNGFVNQWSVLKTDNFSNSYQLIKEFPAWKSLVINEKGENDQLIESQIYIPQQLSIDVQCWIFTTINLMNKMIPHTLPKQIHTEVVEELNKKLYLRYKSICNEKQLISNQKIAWQILFDMKVLIGLFTLRDGKMEKESFQELVNECRSIIDPFDFDVFYPHVINNIKDNISRMQHEMGLMIPYANYSILLAQTKSHSTHDSEPNIISMSFPEAEKNWLPLLPIITKSKVLTTDMERTKQQQQPVVKRSPMPINSSSSALSSLQEWFK